ncbi:subunit Brf1 of transcription initiation factor IIB, partial [Hamiltosporidium magnivora]
PTCDNCSESQFVTEDVKHGQLVCTRCGLVVGDKIIDEGSEWRTFGDSNSMDPSRVGGPNNPLLECEQLDTLISSGSGLNSYTLSKTQMKSSLRGPERALIHGFNLISAFCDRSNITKTVMDRAKFIFKTVEEKKILKGKNTESVVAACIYIACRQENCARTFKEVSVLTAVPKKEVGRSYKLIFPHVDKMAVVSTEDIVARFCSDLNLGIELQKVAVKISRGAQQSGCIAGKSPDSVAAAVIYMVTHLFSNQRKVQKDIQHVTNVTDVTIKNTYKELLPYKYEIIPEGLVSKYQIDSLPNT